MDNDTITYDANHAIAQNAGRHQMQNCFLPGNYQCMAGIVAALKTDDSLCFFSKQIDYLAFAFVTPLGTDYNYVLTHLFSSSLATLEGRQ